MQCRAGWLAVAADAAQRPPTSFRCQQPSGTTPVIIKTGETGSRAAGHLYSPGLTLSPFPLPPPPPPPSRGRQALLGALLLPPVVAGLTGILQRAGPWMGLQLWAFLLALALFAVSVYPTLVAPLFNTFQPLPPGPLR